MAELNTIFDGNDLGVMFAPGEGELLRITFSCWGAPHPSWQRTINGMGSIPALYVFGKRDHWYNTDELQPALTAIAPIRDAFPKAMLMGSSMGGHAAIRLSKRLRADAVMAFSPQYCIQPDLVGHFDTQWTKYLPGISKFDAPISRETAAGRIYVLYDNLHPLDVHHAALIAAAVPVTRVKLPLTGHSVARPAADLRLLPIALSVGESDEKHIQVIQRTFAEQGQRSAWVVAYRAGLLPLSERQAYLARHTDIIGMPDARAQLEQLRIDPADAKANKFFHQHRVQERAAAVPGVREMIYELDAKLAA